MGLVNPVSLRSFLSLVRLISRPPPPPPGGKVVIGNQKLQQSGSYEVDDGVQQPWLLSPVVPNPEKWVLFTGVGSFISRVT